MPGKRERRIARANARLRYGPEERALAVLVGQARDELATDVRVAHGAAATAIRGARRARKPLARIYAEAQSAADVAHQDVEAAFGRTGAGADPFRAITDREFALAQTRRADAAARERSDLVRQENQARLGRLFAVGAAKQRFRSTLGQLQQRAEDLRGEKLDYTVSQLNELASERAKIRESRRAERVRHKHAQENIRLQADLNRRNKGGGGGAGGYEPASRSERRMFKSDYARALDLAQQYARQGSKREQVAKNLRAGIPGETVKLQPGQKDPRTGKKVKLPTSYKIPAVSAVDDELALRAALDVAYNEYVDTGTVDLLHQAGIRVDELGAYTRQGLRRARRRPVGTGGKAPF